MLLFKKFVLMYFESEFGLYSRSSKLKLMSNIFLNNLYYLYCIDIIYLKIYISCGYML